VDPAQPRICLGLRIHRFPAAVARPVASPPSRAHRRSGARTSRPRLRFCIAACFIFSLIWREPNHPWLDRALRWPASMSCPISAGGTVHYALGYINMASRWAAAGPDSWRGCLLGPRTVSTAFDDCLSRPVSIIAARPGSFRSPWPGSTSRIVSSADGKARPTSVDPTPELRSSRVSSSSQDLRFGPQKSASITESLRAKITLLRVLIRGDSGLPDGDPRVPVQHNFCTATWRSIIP